MFCFIFLTNIFCVLRGYTNTYKYSALPQASYVTGQPNRTGLVTILLELLLIKAPVDVWNILTLSIKLNYAMPSVVISNGPVAQPGRVPDFYPMKEIRLSRVRIPTGPQQYRFLKLDSSITKTFSFQSMERKSVTVQYAVFILRSWILFIIILPTYLLTKKH